MSEPEAPELEPVADDGISALWVGMALWAITGVILLVLSDVLADRGAEWWLMVCGAGLIIGLVELGIFRARVSQEDARGQDPRAGRAQPDNTPTAGASAAAAARTDDEHGAGSHHASDPNS
jgi:ABC-type nickel/cobalt efflux system permease component RcnA